MKKVSFYNIGCKVNYADLSRIKEQFADDGWTIVEFGDSSDVVLINTCSVTHNADSDARKVIRRARRYSPNAFIGVMGCYAQLKPGEISQIEGVDAIFGTSQKFKIKELVGDFGRRNEPEWFCSGVDNAIFEASSSGDSDSRTRAILKLQDGCDYNCSYCTIPLARGGSRSMSFNQIPFQVDKLIKAGYREIILSGINLGEYKAESGENFTDVLKLLAASDAEVRFRISSIEPNLVNDEIIEIMAGSNKICKHFHIPLQSGSSEVLKLMRRRYKADSYRKLVYKIKELIPDACIGGDIITGHPGESEANFNDTYKFISDLPISYLHVFSYSERPNTHAVSIDSKVSQADRNYRTQALRAISDEKRLIFNISQVGSIQQVIPEHDSFDGDSVAGWSSNYLQVRFKADKEIEGLPTWVKILSAGLQAVIGEKI